MRNTRKFLAPVVLVGLTVALASCNIVGNPPPAGTFTVTSAKPLDDSGNATTWQAVYPKPSIRLEFSEPPETTTLNGSTITMSDSNGKPIVVSYSLPAYQKSVSVSPMVTLDTGATYTLKLSSGVKSATGKSLEPVSYTLTVRSQPLPVSNYTKLKLTTDGVNPLSVQNPTVIRFGPDGRLYIAQLGGQILVADIQDVGNLKEAKNVITVNALQGRSITGMTVAGTAAAPEIWASSADMNQSQGGADPNTNPYGGMVSRLSGNTFSTRQDVITGIPRSAEYHQVNGVAFGPDGNLYINVGGMTNYGGPASQFGDRPEKLLSSDILVADVHAILATSSHTLNVQPQGEGGGYAVDQSNFEGLPDATHPVRVYATGMRNPYDLVWTHDNLLFSTDNGGNPNYGTTPDPNTCPGAQNPPLGDNLVSPDKINLVQAGHWYGHPNPARSECALGYPGLSPEPAGFTPPQAIAGFDTSTDGITEYTATTDGNLNYGDLLVVNYAAAKGVMVYKRDKGTSTDPCGDGNTVCHPIDPQSSFDNPLSVAVQVPDPTKPGTVFVSEFGPLSQNGYTGVSVISYLVHQ